MSFANLSLSATHEPIPPFTAEEASKALESVQGTAKFVQYAKLRNFLDNPAAREIQELTPAQMDANWNMQRHFGQIKMISTNPRSARCQQSQKELASIGLLPSDYEIVPGVDSATIDKSIWSRMIKWGTEKLSASDAELKLRGQTGCYLAHYNVLKDTATRYHAAVAKLKAARAMPETTSEELLTAIQAVQTYSSVFIFEDNVGVGKVTDKRTADTTGYGVLFRHGMKELKPDWDMLYLMSMYGATRVSEHLGLLGYGLLTKCYAISARMYDRALQALEVVEKPGAEFKPVDHMFASMHKAGTATAYISLPPLCYRAASQSEVGADLGKKKKDEPSHWQSSVTLQITPAEEIMLRKTIAAHCAAPHNICRLPNLATKAAELRAHNFRKAKELLYPVNDFTNKNSERSAKKELADSSRHLLGAKFDATDIILKQSFMFAGCPQDYKGAGALMSVLLARKGTVIVSTLESHEAEKKGNNFWKKENVSKLVMLDGAKVEHISETDIGHGNDNSKIVKTVLKITNDVLPSRTLTHLHYYGWVDRQAAPDDALLFALIMRMRELNPDPTVPFSINCHGGVGRTGTTGMCAELFQEIDTQRKAGKPLDEIEVNILETLFKMRMQGRNIISQETAFSQIFAVVGMYYNYLKIQELIAAGIQEGLEMAQLNKANAAALIAEYAV